MVQKRDSYRWVVASLLFLILFTASFSMQAMPPLFPEISKQIPLTKTQMGTIMGVVTFASLFFSPIGGMLCDIIGPRWVIGISSAIISIAGVSRYFCRDAAHLIISMFMLGAGAAMCGPGLPKVLGTWFLKKELGLVNGICISGMGIGGAAAMASANSIMLPNFGDWRNTMAVIGIFALMVALLWIAVYSDAHVQSNTREPNIRENFKKVLAVYDVWRIAIYYALNMIALMAILALLPVSFAERGLKNAGELVAVMMSMMVVFNIVGGAVSDKVGRRKLFLIISAVILGICIPGFAFLRGLPLILVLMVSGAAIGTIAPVLMSIPVEMRQIGTSLAGTAIGFIFMIGNTGGFIGPVLVGKLMDVSGSSTAGFIVMGFCLVFASLIIVPIEETGVKGEQPT